MVICPCCGAEITEPVYRHCRRRLDQLHETPVDDWTQAQRNLMVGLVLICTEWERHQTRVRVFAVDT